MEARWAAGLMTGTVLDGNIDVALLRTDGERIDRFGPYELAPYPADTRALLEETLRQARQWNFEGPEPAIFREAEEMHVAGVPLVPDARDSDLGLIQVLVAEAGRV